MIDTTMAPARQASTNLADDVRGPMVPRPVFLVGAVRSGTTLLRLMLDHHPELAFDHEFEYAIDRLGPDGRHPDLAAYHAYLRRCRIFQDTGYEVDRDLDYPHLVDSFLRQKQQRSGKGLVGATVHHDFGRVLEIWPDARFIHLVRDGRDVSLSIDAYGWTGTPYVATDWWLAAERAWDDLCRRVPRDRRVEIRFEDLIEHPEDALESICAFLDLDYADGMLSYPDDTTYAAPSRRRVDRWRQVDPETLALIEARMATMLARRGYELSGLPLPAITPTEHRQFRRRARWAHARKRLRDHGLVLFGLDALARRLHAGPLQDWIRPHLHAVERARLQ